MNDKQDLYDKATEIYKEAVALHQETKQPGLSETQVHNKAEEAQAKHDLATTLDSVSRAIKP
jgi:hypothetical protein